MGDDHMMRQVRELNEMQQALARLGEELAGHTDCYVARREDLAHAVMNIESARWMLMEIEEALRVLLGSEAPDPVAPAEVSPIAQ